MSFLNAVADALQSLVSAQNNMSIYEQGQITHKLSLDFFKN